MFRRSGCPPVDIKQPDIAATSDDRVDTASSCLADPHSEQNVNSRLWDISSPNAAKQCNLCLWSSQL